MTSEIHELIDKVKVAKTDKEKRLSYLGKLIRPFDASMYEVSLISLLDDPHSNNSRRLDTGLYNSGLSWNQVTDVRNTLGKFLQELQLGGSVKARETTLEEISKLDRESLRAVGLSEAEQTIILKLFPSRP